MTAIPPEPAAARERFHELTQSLRPELHRYCTRLVGSAIDGEDVVQEALAKAYYSLSMSNEAPRLRPFLFRIAHNTAIDFLRRYERRFVEPSADLGDSLSDEPVADVEVVRLALSSFLPLPVLQRSCVILKDVLGCSLEEIAETTGTTVLSVKAALVRGRAALAAQPKTERVTWRDRPETSAADRALLSRYASLFNARDWDGVQAMLADECKLELISKAERRGKGKVSQYFGNYSKEDVRLALGEAEGRAVLGVYRPSSAERPQYVIVLELVGDRVGTIRDFRYVPYLMDELDYQGA